MRLIETVRELNLGRKKFFLERVLSYIQRAISVITLIASFKILDISYWWLVLSPAVVYGIYWFDRKFVVEDEVAASFRFGKKALEDGGYRYVKEEPAGVKIASRDFESITVRTNAHT